ncbi:hypothetical protein C8R45DRAFT_949291 [Mycena sanguinolenta]|nr:hypothetical protein C8R45DRAFT_949291 [Mycena sanguinolenta]
MASIYLLWLVYMDSIGDAVAEGSHTQPVSRTCRIAAPVSRSSRGDARTQRSTLRASNPRCNHVQNRCAVANVARCGPFSSHLKPSHTSDLIQLAPATAFNRSICPTQQFPIMALENEVINDVNYLTDPRGLVKPK